MPEAAPATSSGPAAPLALAAGSLLDTDAAGLAAAAAAAGFALVGLRLPHHSPYAGVPALRRRLDDLGVAVHDVEVHRIGSGDDPRPLIEAAAALGARHVLVVSDVADESATTEALGALAERCRAAGVVAAVEYMAWTTPSLPGAAVRLAEATGAVVVVDLLHHVRVGASVDDLRAIVSSGHLGWVQVCDGPAGPPADLVHEARHGRLPPGTGELPLRTLLAAVPDDCVISVEVQSDALAAALAPSERAVRLYTAASLVIA